nr:MAG TPA: Putative tail protein [Caudoviricetes sp.]
MINVSDAFKQKLQDGERVWQEVEITFPDGTVKTVKNEIMGENCTFSDCAESSSFPIGCVVCKSMTLELDNTSDQWKNYNFYMAKVHAYLKMQTSVASSATTDELPDENYEPILDQSGGAILGTKAATEDRVETIDKGIYTITTPEQYGEILSFTALDDMYKTNATYISHLVLPQSIETLVRDACETLGIPSEVSMAHGNLIVSEIPENMTFRQLVGWAAMLETANARLDSRGYLRFIRWDFSNVQEDYNAVVDDDGNVTFKGGASIDSESFISPTGNWTIDSDGFLTLIESVADTSEKLKDFFTSPTVSSDDIVITGIKLKNRENEAMYGITGYVLELENDLVADSDLDTVAAQIGDSIIGAKFRNMSGELAYNPLIEFGDMAYTYDRKWNRYITPLTDVSCFVNGKTTVKTQADDPIRGQSKFQSESTKAIVEARRLVKKEKTSREKAVEKLEETLKNSSGLYETSVTQEDGSTITYLHDKPTLAESKNVIKFTAEAIGVSNDGGKTYPYGFFLTGDLIAKILYAHGINADYIDTGALIVRDSDGNIIFQVDMDTKKVIISGDSVVIGGKTATKALSDNLQESKDYSDGKLADYADTVTGSLAGLQAQIDGQIESFFYDYEPSLQNKPASEWTSTEERKKHEGDLFYWKSTGYAYRFMQDGATWKWQMIQDNDISKALAQAEKAQDTADGKRRTFVIQPSPPYDIGDLWSQDGGDILTCVVARAKGSVYASSDWKKLNKYTDDTTANKALEAAALAKNMTLQLSNEMQTITADADGNIAVFPQVSTKATVMYGSSDITDDCSYTITKSDSITGSWSDATHIYNVTGLSADNGWIDIRATYLSNLSVTKRFTISKQKKGEDGKDGEPGRTYMVEPSCNVLKRGSDKTISPNFITFKAYYRDGKSATRVPYKGRFVVEETADGNTWNTIYTSSTDEDTVTHYLYSILTNGSGQTVASSNGSTIGIPRDVTNVRCKLYASGGTTTLMDMQSVAVVIDIDNLTQEQIVSILTNDGAWKGLYYSNGRLYVSLDALLGGTVTLGGKKNGNGYLKIKDASNAVKGLIDRSGYTVFTSYEENSKYMKYTGVQFSSDGIFPVDIKKFFDDEVDIEIENSENWGISWNDNSLNVYATEVSADTGTFENLTVTNPASFAKSPKIENMEYTTSSNTVCWDGRTGYKQLMLKSSSSKRYKDIGSDISEQEIEEWYNIEPLWAKYKEGYLVEWDENEGRYIPMFIAEDVEKYFPEATRHANGLVEDWNERIMIPAMFAMIKAQKKKIDQQEKLINKLCEKLNIE